MLPPTRPVRPSSLQLHCGHLRTRLRVPPSVSQPCLPSCPASADCTGAATPAPAECVGPRSRCEDTRALLRQHRRTFRTPRREHLLRGVQFLDPAARQTRSSGELEYPAADWTGQCWPRTQRAGSCRSVRRPRPVGTARPKLQYLSRRPLPQPARRHLPLRPSRPH